MGLGVSIKWFQEDSKTLLSGLLLLFFLETRSLYYVALVDLGNLLVDQAGLELLNFCLCLSSSD